MRQVLSFLVSLFCVLVASGQEYQNVTELQGIEVFNTLSVFGNGVSFADFNSDGWDDLSFGSNVNDPIFYINEGGFYNEVDLGIVNDVQGDIKAIIWLDYDNDGDQDLFISTSYFPVKLYNNDGLMNLTDVTEASGIHSQNTRNFGACWGDYNKDGWLDLYLCKFHNPNLDTGYEFENHLYKSNMDGTFVEVANFAGVEDGVLPSFQSVFFDFDNDGWEDLYIINDRVLNYNPMYKNMGDGTFEDVSDLTGTGLYFDAMSITVGDYDNDGDLDVYVSNTDAGNALLQNQGDGTFIDIAESMDILVNEICWGAIWMDYDNDMLQDLYVSTLGNVLTTDLYNRLYRNTGEGFSEVTNDVITDGDVHGTLAVALGDINNDGFPDFVQNNTSPSWGQLYQNTGNDNNWLKVSVEGTISNRDGIGSWVQVYTDTIVQTRTLNCGEQYLSQNSPREMFGLSNYNTIDSVIVRWPSGIIDSFYNLPVNQTIHVVEGSTVILPIMHDDLLSICGEDSILLQATAGVEYSWSTGAETQSIYVSDSGSYSCDVTSEWGLIFHSDTVTISSFPEIELETMVQHLSCYGMPDGSVTFASGDEYELASILWENDSSDFAISNLEAGTFNYTISNVNNCWISDTITITQPDSLIASVVVSDVLCYGESTGQANISWSGGTGNIYCNDQGWDTQSLAAGLYAWECMDDNNCLSTVQFQVNQPDELVVDLTTTGISEGEQGGAELEISGGTLDYTIEWSTGSDETEIDILDAGEFSVHVTDSNGCDTTITFVITSIQEIENELYQVYPNPFRNDFYFSNKSSQEAQFEMTNLLGQKIFSKRVSPGVHLIQMDEELRSGVCILTITTDKGTTMIQIVKIQ